MLVLKKTPKRFNNALWYAVSVGKSVFNNRKNVEE